MANDIQFIREYVNPHDIFDNNNNDEDDDMPQPEQLSQVMVNNRFVLELFHVGNRVVVQNIVQNEMFYIYSPDLPNMTIRDILKGIGYNNHRITVHSSYPGNHSEQDVLDSPAHTAPVSQIKIYSQ